MAQRLSPQGFETVWEAVWEAAQELSHQSIPSRMKMEFRDSI
jgi:hypothetical protein